MLMAGSLMTQRAHAEIIVTANTVVREKPPGIGGVVINAHDNAFLTGAGGIDFQGDLKAAKVKLVRRLAFPDARFPEGKTIETFDKTFQAILACGAQPLFIQYIKPPERIKSGNPYLTADGKPGGTPESNLIFMVKRYQASPYNLKIQYWQVGNEPDIGIDEQLSKEDYAVVFNGFHEALIRAGLRDQVKLCGPVTSGAYYWTAPPKPGEQGYIEYFINHCAHSVDIIDYHTYAGAKDEQGVLTAPHKLDFQFDPERQFVTDPKTRKLKDYYGMAALLVQFKKMKFTRPDVGIALTEHNTQRDSISRTLWNLAVTHYWIYNPLGRFTTQFVYDDCGSQQGGFGAYDANKQKSFGYWALWINGNLRGSHVLEQKTTGNRMKDGRPWLFVTATRDQSYLYVEVINRNTEPVKDHVVIKGSALAGPATVQQMTEQERPDRATPLKVRAPFEYEFPGLSATIFKFPIGSQR